MARTPQLNWCPGSGKRSGRWRVRYKGKAHYFNAGRGKSDRDARRRAEAEWLEKKRQIDAEIDSMKPNRDGYDQVIEEWSRVRKWCIENGEIETAELAAASIETLTERLASPEPSPIQERDRFQPIAKRRYRFDEAVALGDMPNNVRVRVLTYLQDKATWEERLRSQKTGAGETTANAQFDQYMALQDSRVKSGQIAVSRREHQRSHLASFVESVGRDFDVRHITSETVSGYFTSLSLKVAQNEISQTTASDKWSIAKKFIRWLWSKEVLADAPRNLDSKDFKFARPPRKIETLTVAQIHAALKRPTPDRTRLYILLMLNCGFTQVDIADLVKDEVDFSKGYILRRRSKTRGKSSVPIVRYPLWPETATLLREQASTDSDYVLLNSKGKRLRIETLDKNGKYKKTDNIRSAWQRLCSRLDLSNSLTSLRKTSATTLRSEPRYSTIYEHFLGHAPKTVADRHYASAPDDLLEEAIFWLRKQYQIESCLEC